MDGAKRKSLSGDKDRERMGSALVSLSEWIYAVERPPGILKVVLVSVLLAASMAIVYFTGGTYLSYLHIFYIPIILANFLLGVIPGGIAAIVAGVLVGIVPLNVAEGISQHPLLILYRMAFFVLVSLVAGLAASVARSHISHLQIKVREKTAELEKHYRELKELQETKEFLTSMIVHDLKSSLSSVLLAADVLKMRYQKVLDVEGKNLLDTSLSSGKRMLDMILNILDVYGMESGRLLPRLADWDPAQGVREVVEDFRLQATHKKISLEIKLEDDLPRIQADPELVHRIMANLLHNAIAHTPAGGKIAFEGNLVPQDGVLRIGVYNSGSVIPEEWKERIFEKFFKADEQDNERTGSGLGLAFCKMAVEAHGGRIWAETRTENEPGTVLYFTLPLGH